MRKIKLSSWFGLTLYEFPIVIWKDGTVNFILDFLKAKTLVLALLENTICTLLPVSLSSVKPQTSANQGIKQGTKSKPKEKWTDRTATVGPVSNQRPLCNTCSSMHMEPDLSADESIVVKGPSGGFRNSWVGVPFARTKDVPFFGWSFFLGEVGGEGFKQKRKGREGHSQLPCNHDKANLLFGLTISEAR